MAETTPNGEPVNGCHPSLFISSAVGGKESDAGRCEHVVQFYENDAILVQSAGIFVGAGLGVGEGAIVLATPAHCDAIEARLAACGFNPASLKADGRYVALDAGETLSQFMRGGMPNESLFNQVVGGLIARVNRHVNGAGLRTFGEMVALLWAEKNHPAAIKLEKLWNNLAKIHSFKLFCAYPEHGFHDDICREHTQVTAKNELVPRAPTEAVNQLQKRNDFLETELAGQKRDDEMQQRLAAIVESSDDAIVSKNLDGIITSWNNGAERIFGYTADEVIGKPITLLIPEDHHNEEPAILERLRRGERIDHYETVRRHKNGKRLDISLTISPVKDATGRIIGASKIGRDITERRQMERALRETRDELAKVNAELEQRVEHRTASLREAIAQMEEFSYTVSHDLRAPARAMCGYAQVVMDEYGDRLNDIGREYLRRIVRGGSRMDQLIQDILTYSRLSRREVQLGPVSLDKLVREIPHQYPEMRYAGAEIVICGQLLPVIGHEPSLMQAVSNLLNNAMKFVAPGTVPRVRIRTERRDHDVRLWVEDNGIGIKPEHQNRLFGVFERLHPGKNYEGTGIGLAIVRRAAERMDGKVGVESDGLTGSNFWIQLPAADSA